MGDGGQARGVWRSGPRLALGLLLAAGVVNYVDRIALSIASPLIGAELHLRPSQLGLLLSIFPWAYALAQAPAGALADRAPPRRLLAGALVIWSAAQGAAALAVNLPQLAMARLFLGFGEAPQWPTAARVVRGWFAPGQRGLATGIFNSASTLGPAIAPPLVTALMLAFGWRCAFVATGLAGIAVAAAWALLYRDRNTTPATPAEPPPGWLALLRQPTLWAMAVGNFGSGYVTWFFAAWLPSYLETARHLTLLQTGWAASIPYAFGFVGSLAGGWACDRLARTGLSPLVSIKAPLVVGLALGGACTGLAVVAPGPALAIAAISAALMFANVATASIWALAVVAAPERAVASVGAIQNIGGFFGGAAAPIATGFLLEATHSFAPALAVTAAAGLAGALVYLFGVVRPIRG